MMTQTYRPRHFPKGQNRPLEDVQTTRKPKKRALQVGKLNLKLGKGLAYPLVILIISALLMAANHYNENLTVNGLDIQLVEGMEHPFMNQEQIQSFITEGDDSCLLGIPYRDIDLKMLEERLEANPFIKQAEVYKNLNGTLTTTLSMREPMARLINNEGDYLYLDVDGVKMPSSDVYSAYVPLVRGDFEEFVADTFSCSTVEEVIPVLQFIHQNPFWKAQIAEVVLKQNGELEILPQLGHQMAIRFGYPVRIQEKFNLLMDFYQQVIPKVGWKYYRTISLKFKGQVVAKK